MLVKKVYTNFVKLSYFVDQCIVIPNITLVHILASLTVHFDSLKGLH